jgi:hypothetical protein
MMLRSLPIVLAALLTVPAASAEDSVVIRSSRAQVESFAGTAVESVSRRPLRDNERWETLDDYALLIWESPSRAYLVGLERDGDPRCADLSSE